MGKKLVILIVCCVYSIISHGSNRIDSLTKLVENAPQDTNLVESYNTLAKEYWSIDPKNSLEFGFQAVRLSKKLNFLSGEASSYNTIGVAHEYMSAYDSTLHYYNKALEIFTRTDNQHGVATSNNNLGVVYYFLGDYDKSVQHYITSLRIQEKLGNELEAATSRQNIGIIYKNQGLYDKAISYYLDALKIREKHKDDLRIAQTCVNLGIVYDIIEDYETSLAYYQRAYDLYDKNGQLYYTANVTSNLGILYSHMGNHQKALDAHLQTLDIKNQLNDKRGLAISYKNIAECHEKLGDKMNGLLAYQKALEIAEDIHLPEIMMEGHHGIAKIYKERANYKDAYRHFELYAMIKDSLLNLENTSNISQLTSRYEIEKATDSLNLLKKQAELAEFKAKSKSAEAEHHKAQHEAERERSKATEYKYTAGVLVLLIISIIGFFMFYQKRRINLTLTKQKDIIEKKNREITDSIEYAKRIQSTILPTDKEISPLVEDYFILYKPKDIVAGDFYWFEKMDDDIFFAVADCTGHGVPGAMVSVVCSNSLNKAVCEEGIKNTDDILDRTRELVLERFEKHGNNVKDGMDIALCRYNKVSGIFQYSGANNPLYLIRGDEIIERSANRQPVGRFGTSETFDRHDMEYVAGDIIYLFTDGFKDQFGGPKGKKFKTSKFKQYLYSIHKAPFEEQKRMIDETFEDWRGERIQLDDVCVIGVRV